MKKENIKIFLIVLFVAGWLVPKVSLGASVGIQDLASVLLLINFKIKKDVFHLFYGELVYAILLLFFAVIEFVMYNSLDGFLISVRILLYVLAGISILRYNINIIQKSFRVIVKIYIVYFIYNFLIIIFYVLNGGVSLAVFLLGYGDFRIKAPFEGGGTTTVPIGYMLSLLLTVTFALYGRLTNIFFSLCALGTASRSAILSVFLILGRQMNFRKISSWLFALPIVILFLGFIYMKSFGSDSGSLDGSSSKRMELYTYALKVIWENPSALLIGVGVSGSVLEARLGESFFESMLFNSLVQGGVLLLLSSVFIIVKSIYYDYRYKLNYLSIPILIGNVIGGSNYFSMFAFPLMVLIIAHKIGSNQKSTILKSFVNA